MLHVAPLGRPPGPRALLAVRVRTASALSRPSRGGRPASHRPRAAGRDTPARLRDPVPGRWRGVSRAGRTPLAYASSREPRARGPGRSDRPARRGSAAYRSPYARARRLAIGEALAGTSTIGSGDRRGGPHERPIPSRGSRAARCRDGVRGGARGHPGRDADQEAGSPMEQGDVGLEVCSRRRAAPPRARRHARQRGNGVARGCEQGRSGSARGGT